MYRVVLTCWDQGEFMPYADDFSGVKLSLFPSKELAQAAVEQQVAQELQLLNDIETDSPREKEPIEDCDGNIVGYDYPFRGDFVSDHTGVVRFWDGDDYQNVTAYDVYPLNCDCADLDKCSYFKYRGFWILPNEAHTSFKVEQFDVPLFRRNSLEGALREIDSFLVKMQYGKPSLESVLTMAAIAFKEREDVGVSVEGKVADRIR